MDVYLRTHSPYLDSSFPYSKSQNIIGVNLLGNHSTSYTCYIINFLFTYIPSLLVSLPWYFLQGFIIYLLPSYSINKVKQYATKSTSYNAIYSSYNLRVRRRHQYKGYRFAASYGKLVTENS